MDYHVEILLEVRMRIWICRFIYENSTRSSRTYFKKSLNSLDSKRSAGMSFFLIRKMLENSILSDPSRSRGNIKISKKSSVFKAAAQPAARVGGGVRSMPPTSDYAVSLKTFTNNFFFFFLISSGI